MKNVIGIFLVLLFPVLLSASPRISAKRLPGESFEFIRQKFISNNNSALESAVPLNKVNLSRIKQNYSAQQLNDGFKYVRDFQFIQDPKHEVVRRSTWLYPDDGCFARAALMENNLEKVGLERPSKLFIFGNLHVKTSNALLGYVEWWFHVVPVVKSNGKAYVFDPAVDPSKPLDLATWVAKVAPSGEPVRISICNSHTYLPDDSCDSSNTQTDQDALNDQVSYLEDEWGRLEELSRSPVAELGSAPPW